MKVCRYCTRDHGDNNYDCPVVNRCMEVLSNLRESGEKMRIQVEGLIETYQIELQKQTCGDRIAELEADVKRLRKERDHWMNVYPSDD